MPTTTISINNVLRQPRVHFSKRTCRGLHSSSQPYLACLQCIRSARCLWGLTCAQHHGLEALLERNGTCKQLLDTTTGRKGRHNKPSFGLVV